MLDDLEKMIDGIFPLNWMSYCLELREEWWELNLRLS